MVKREFWGELKDHLMIYPNDTLTELCCFLEIPYSGNKGKKIKRILNSEYSKDYVLEKLNKLNFYLLLIDYFSSDELTDILDNHDLPRRRSKWEKMVEIFCSGEVSPRELLGMLGTSEIEEFYFEDFENKPTGTRDEIINEILNNHDLELTYDLGFIMMDMREDKFLNRTYQIIKEVNMNFGINAERADEYQSSELISKEILDTIESAEYLFIDLTGERPNVYYELGYCHGLKKDNNKIILLAREGTKRHFDIHGLRTIIYRNHDELRTNLIQRLKAITNRL